MHCETMGEKYVVAYKRHKASAAYAFAIYRHFCGGTVPPRVPGYDTVIRLAWRIECGHSIEAAAAREYVYRWHLAIKPFDQCAPGIVNPCCSIFGAPHTIGM